MAKIHTLHLSFLLVLIAQTTGLSDSNISTVNLVNSTVRFDIRQGAIETKPIDRQLISLSIECNHLVS